MEFDLIVVLAVGEDGHLVQVFGEPRRRFRDVDEAVFDHRGLRVQAHRLVNGRLVTRDSMAAIGDQFLDQLGTGSLVLDQHDSYAMPVLLLAHRSLECRIFETLAEEIKEKEILVPYSPSRAYREIAELGRFVGRIPALHDAVEARGQFVLAIALEPCRLDQAAAQRSRRLLILTGEIVFADCAPDASEGFERLAVGVQRLALTAGEAPRSPDRLDLVRFVSFGDRRKAQNLPVLLRQDVTDEVIFVQPLHDDDDGAALFIVLPAVEGVVVPLVGHLPLRVGERLLRLQRIID